MDGGYVIAGITKSFGCGGKDVYLIKTDDSGDTLWTKTFGGSGWDYGYSVQQTTDGGYIIGGFTDSFGVGGNDVYLINTDSYGDTLWTRTIGGSESDYCYSMDKTSDGGFIIVGETESYGAGMSDVYLIKIDDSPVGIGGVQGGMILPKTFSLSQNYPNPFNPSTTIQYDIPTGSRTVPVKIYVYDIRGRLVRKLVNQEKEPGQYQVHWDSSNDLGQAVSSYVYLYRIEAGKFISTRKMVLVR